MRNNELVHLAQCIWRTSEQVSQLLRNATRLELKDRRGNLLIDKLSEKQSVMVLTVRTLCQEHPEGVPLKQIANQLGITPASASVMVDALNRKGFLIRKASLEDRRAVQITLSTKANAFYDSADETILKHVLQIGEELGPEVIVQWHDVLKQVKKHLIQGL